MVQRTDRTVGEQIDCLQRSLGLSTEELSSALRVAPCTIESWQYGETAPEAAARQRLDALVALHRHLGETLKSEAVPQWLRAKPRTLGGVTPAEVIVGGDFDRIDRLLTIIDYGMFA